MGLYYIYDTAQAPAELTTKHPHAAQYASITLFVSGAAEPLGVVDIASMGFSEVEGEGLTKAQLDTMVDSLVAPEPPPTGAEVQISKAQANYLYETRFKPIDSEEGL